MEERFTADDITPEIVMKYLPFGEPFRFVENLTLLSDNRIEGYFTFREDMDFFRGHFPGKPVVPGVILIECLAQIGSACMGLYRTIKKYVTENEVYKNNEVYVNTLDMVMVGCETEFFKPVFPGDRVTVVADLIYDRFGKTKAEIKGYNQHGEYICRSLHSGMFSNLKLSK